MVVNSRSMVKYHRIIWTLLKSKPTANGWTKLCIHDKRPTAVTEMRYNRIKKTAKQMSEVAHRFVLLQCDKATTRCRVELMYEATRQPRFSSQWNSSNRTTRCTCKTVTWSLSWQNYNVLTPLQVILVNIGCQISMTFAVKKCYIFFLA